ncbi:ABC transporter substrate-binding protein [Lentibacter algarum]|uniref:heme/hemin ABC transporter substrate-binding protein n=1 Tax=Lentibacter algarum TaxID=576131 RepID=UPI001C09DE38|nr:ABC transporter substrate-binding protein [Lentibacter algarum]MBU2982632.1 ABC transporter substrate-binding protein [Lentibacter algarum]
MTRLHPLFLLQVVTSLAIFLFIATTAWANEKPSRIVSIGGSITEIIYALGEEDRLVARDTTSNHPSVATALPDVGYIRRLSPEGLLSVNPDLIIAREGAGPLETMELMREAEIDLAEIPHGFTAKDVALKITSVADALGVPDKGAALADKVTAEIETAHASVGEGAPKRVLFVLSIAGGNITAAGDNTEAGAIIEMAGGVNALKGVEGYKQMSPEAVATSNPDVILVMDRGGDHGISLEGIKAHPALSTTPAAMNDALVKLDGMLILGFSVRTGEAVASLSQALATVGE